MILLDQDPLATLPDHLSGIKVEQTYIGGELVWERNPGKS